MVRSGGGKRVLLGRRALGEGTGGGGGLGVGDVDISSGDPEGGA